MMQHSTRICIQPQPQQHVSCAPSSTGCFLVALTGFLLPPTRVCTTTAPDCWFSCRFCMRKAPNGQDPTNGWRNSTHIALQEGRSASSGFASPLDPWKLRPHAGQGKLAGAPKEWTQNQATKVSWPPLIKVASAVPLSCIHTTQV